MNLVRQSERPDMQGWRAQRRWEERELQVTRHHVALTWYTETVSHEPSNVAASGILEQILAKSVRKWRMPRATHALHMFYTWLNLSNNLNRVGINDLLEPKDKSTTLQTPGSWPWESCWKEISEAETWPAECSLMSCFVLFFFFSKRAFQSMLDVCTLLYHHEIAPSSPGQCQIAMPSEGPWEIN